ncbi:MAG: preprotein translocase subunit SecG [Terrimicrobiaceae bacterium]
MPILVALHVIVCLLLVLVVLMQRPRSEGLGSAFGGGITDNVFGSQTTNVLARFTTWMAIAFFAITLLLSIITAKMHGGTTEIQKKLLASPTPEAPTPSVAEKTADATTAMGLVNAVVPKISPTPAPTTPAPTTPAPATPAPAAAEPTATPAAQNTTAPAPAEALASPAPVEQSTPPAEAPQN